MEGHDRNGVLDNGSVNVGVLVLFQDHLHKEENCILCSKLSDLNSNSLLSGSLHHLICSP